MSHGNVIDVTRHTDPDFWEESPANQLAPLLQPALDDPESKTKLEKKCDFAMVSGVDEQLRRLMAAVEAANRKGGRQKTNSMFTSEKEKMMQNMIKESVVEARAYRKPLVAQASGWAPRTDVEDALNRAVACHEAGRRRSPLWTPRRQAINSLKVLGRRDTLAGAAALYAIAKGTAELSGAASTGLITPAQVATGCEVLGGLADLTGVIMEATAGPGACEKIREMGDLLQKANAAGPGSPP